MVLRSDLLQSRIVSFGVDNRTETRWRSKPRSNRASSHTARASQAMIFKIEDVDLELSDVNAVVA
jgi:hypothetical protein